MPWPKLSETLPYERHPDVCQSCGARATLGAELEIWRECDEQDKPTPVWINLCGPCGSRIIEPHPRLYERSGRNCPAPGAMAHLCTDCAHRDGLACLHPHLKANGGVGLRIKVKPPTVAHLYYGGRRGQWLKLWPELAESCAGRTPKQQQAA